MEEIYRPFVLQENTSDAELTKKTPWEC
jgi:hypothetical protein